MKQSGTCARGMGRLFLPEAIMHHWERDSTGTPGVVVAGFFIAPDGTKVEPAFIWVQPKALDRFRPPQIDPPKAETVH